jgi:hypothetical protein
MFERKKSRFRASEAKMKRKRYAANYLDERNLVALAWNRFAAVPAQRIKEPRSG